MSYNNPVPVVVATIQLDPLIKGFRMLAVRRAIPPHVGGLAFPGGYVNEGESAEEAISREFAEEVGTVIQAEFWKPHRTLVTPGNQLLIFMACKGVAFTLDQLAANFKQNEEVSGIFSVSTSETLCFPLHDHVLKTFNFDIF